MDIDKASIRRAARQLLAVRADILSRRLGLSERLRPAQQTSLRRSAHRLAAAGAKVILNDQAESGLGTKTPDSLADAAFDPRNDRKWSRR